MKTQTVALFVRIDDELDRRLREQLERARAAAPPGRTVTMACLVREMLYRAVKG